MRLALLICGVVLLIVGLRLINVDQDVVTAVFVAFIAILCFWGAFAIHKVGQNNELE